MEKGRFGRRGVRELLWSFFLFLLLAVEPRGLVGATGGTGQGSVLLPWLLKPEVAVEEGEKPPLAAPAAAAAAQEAKKTFHHVFPSVFTSHVSCSGEEGACKKKGEKRTVVE